MARREPMRCPACGAAMNHHAEKIDYSEEGDRDAVLGGVVQEIHACPACVTVATQRAS